MGGHFEPKNGGQFTPKSVVNLFRNEVVNLTVFSKLHLDQIQIFEIYPASAVH